MASVEFACRLALVIVFGAAAVGKVRTARDREAFRMSLVSLGWLAPAAAGPVAVAVVTAEMACAFLLLVVSPPTFGFVCSALFLTVLTAGLSYSSLRHVQVTCRCFGGRDTRVGAQQFARNAALILVAVVGALSVTLHGTHGPMSGVARLLTVFVAAILALGVLYGEELTYLVRGPERTATQRPAAR
jgi:hypothetical protein